MKIKKICPICKKEFDARNGQTYCSMACNQKARRERHKNNFSELKKKYHELIHRNNELTHKLNTYIRKFGKIKINEYKY
jgi:hypothetical protein